MPLFTINAELSPLVDAVRSLVASVDRLTESVAGPQADQTGPPPEGSLTYISGDTLEELRQKEMVDALKDLTPSQRDEVVRELLEE